MVNAEVQTRIFRWMIRQFSSEWNRQTCISKMLSFL